MKTFRKGGIHPSADKLTSEVPITEFPLPMELNIVLSQCIGAPSRCIVKVGDKVRKGQKIADAGGFVGSPVHSPVNGLVKRVEKMRNPQGLWQDGVVITRTDESMDPIESDGIETLEEALKLTPKEIIDIIGEKGIVGLGGATFPTRVKLSVPDGKKARVVIINGAECEPYLTCDDRLMREHAAEIIGGTLLLMRAVNVDHAIVGIEENKPQAIYEMMHAAESYPQIKVVVLKKKYPQGGEKQLIQACIGREVPEGGLPVDVGAIVDNVATAYAVYDAVVNGSPLTGRVVTVTGPDLKNPGNFYVPIGTTISELIDFAGGLPENTGKVVAGGPMMGKAISSLDAPSTKGLSGVLVLPEKESRRKPADPCIRCAKCVGVCPMGLEPFRLMDLAKHALWEETLADHVMSCLECGSCSYICPSHRPLLDFIKLARIEVRKLPKN